MSKKKKKTSKGKKNAPTEKMAKIMSMKIKDPDTTVRGMMEKA